MRFCKSSILSALAIVAMSGCDSSHNRMVVNLDSEYTNPVIHADYSDPDVVASPDGSTYYLTASSFQCVPGLPILKSHNLVDWELVNYALDSVPPVEFYGNGVPQHGKGVWAPCIRYHNGEYFIYWGDPDFGIFMVKTKNPESKWSKPVLVRPGKGLIDPTPFWDEDGNAYLANAWAGSRSKFNSVITVSEMSADGTCVVGEPRIVFDGNDGVNHTIEGPKLYRKGDYYYILAPAGGVENGWQLALRSKNIYGPYEAKRVMEQGESEINGPHQGAWVTDIAGDDWFIHFQDKGAYGRIIHLNPMTWNNDWPIIGDDTDSDGCGEPVSKYRMPTTMEQPQVNTDINNDIYRQFSWHGNYNDMYGFDIPDGLKRLYTWQLTEAFNNMWEVPNLWLMKFPSEEFIFTTKVAINAKEASNGVSMGVIVMGWDYCRLGLTLDGDNFQLQLVTCHDAEQGEGETVSNIATLPADKIYSAGLLSNINKEIYFRIAVGKDAMCRFSYSLDGDNYFEVGDTFKARAGKWIGAKIGYYAIMPADAANRGWIDVQWAQVQCDTATQEN